MGKKNLFWCVAVLMIGFFFFCGLASAQEKKKEDPLARWKPDFDPSGAKYKVIVSNVSHPVLKGTFAGFAIRDELWKRTQSSMMLKTLSTTTDIFVSIGPLLIARREGS